MEDSLPEWHKLIKAWIDKGRYGLTIPFIVGARTLLAGANTANRTDIENLFSEIIEKPVQDNIVYVRWCDDYEAAVMASYSKNFPFRPQHNVIDFSPSGSSEASLVVLREVANKLGATMNQDEIITALIDYAQPQVVLGHYSRFWTIDGRTYGPFQDEDLEFIRATFVEHAS
jgi:hypothetical protein